MAFLSAELRRGIDIVIEYSKLEEKLEGATFVITGEGSIDGQTRFGKTPYGVAQAAKKQNIPVIALAGNVGEDKIYYMIMDLTVFFLFFLVYKL